MENKRATIIVGLFTTILLASIAALILWKSDLKYRTQGYKLIGVYSNVGGLLKGSEIRYRGYNVGRVGNIIPGPKTIEVELWIDNHIKIPINSEAKVMFDGLVGENFIGIQPNENETQLMMQGDKIYGTSGSDLSNFLDLGSQNMVHAEAILESLRKLITSNEVNSSIKNIVLNFDEVTRQLSQLLNTVNSGTNSKQIEDTINNFHLLSEQLVGTGDQASLAEQLNQIVNSLNSLTDQETIGELKKTIANLERFTSKLAGDEYGSGNLIKTVTTMEMGTDTSIRYTPSLEQAYYQTGLTFDFGRYFFLAELGDREGSNKLLNVQQGFSFNEYLKTRLGLFYTKPGIGFDLSPFNKWTVSMEVYNLNEVEAHLLTRYALRQEVDLMMGLRRNAITKDYSDLDLGMSYHF